MGNSTSSSSSCYGKKKYMPSEVQCDLLYNAMNDAYDEVTELGWAGVDRDLLLLKLLVRLRDDRPEIGSIIKEVFGATEYQKKKRKLSLTTTEESLQPVSLSAAVANDPTFQGVHMPKDVLATIAQICSNRSDCNSFGLTCKAAHQVIEDPRYGVEKLWPTTAGFLRPFYPRPRNRNNNGGEDDGENLVVRNVVFTRDGSRAAVLYGSGTGCPYTYRQGICILAVFDRSIGLIGEFACYGDKIMAPVFSPDGQLLMCGRINHRGQGIEVDVFRFPSDRDQQGPLTVSTHDLGGLNECYAAISFVSNSTAASMAFEGDEVAIPVYQINRDNEMISFSEPYALADPRNIGLPDGGARGRAAYYSDDKTDILAVVYYFGTIAVFHDRKRNVSVTKQTPNGTGRLIEPVFSHDGKLLVIATKKGGEQGGELCLFDLDVDRVENIEQPRVFSFHDGSHGSYVCPSFSPDNKKIIARFHYEYPERLPREEWHHYGELEDDGLQVIDIEKGEIVSEKWEDDTWGEIVS